MHRSLATAKEIFLAALDAGPKGRDRVLDSACAGNTELRGQIEELLRVNDEPDELLDKPRIDVGALGLDAGKTGSTCALLPSEGSGTIIGPFKLLEQIGEGGFGIVFLAEQRQPVRRRVALKILKPGMDTKEVVARFEAERQALAMMDHRHIAKVLDAGATQSGRPYFVMELVQGVPITEYCDQCNLSMRERLELFVCVCKAVQHAHQKGIIHRDLKPSNVLVAIEDGRPSPKVIDFGVAKAISQRLTEQTLQTVFAQMIGTPLYMSPEQAELSAMGVDTRTDIFSLGVLLYELLTGTTPFERERLHEVNYDEMRRIIREEDPPRPSARVSTLGPRVETVAENRRTDFKRLFQLVSGELDWIVMKALEKDRSRRYDSAGALAADVQHYLDNEPVEACPPSVAYRFRKFAVRNRGPVMAVTIVLLAILCGAAVCTWQAIRAYKAEQTARVLAASEHEAKEAEASQRRQAEAVSKFLVSAFRSPNPNKDGHNVTIAEVLDRSAKEVHDKFASDPRTRAALLEAIGESYSSLGLFRMAIPLLEETRELRNEALGPDHRDSLATRSSLAWAYHNSGRVGDAIKLAQDTLALQQVKFGIDDPSTLESMKALAFIYSSPGVARFDEAIELYEQSLKLIQAKSGADNRNTLITMDKLASCYDHAGLTDAAILLEEQALDRMKVHLGPDDLNSLMAMHNLASFYSHARRQADALRVLLEALPLLERTFNSYKTQLGVDHPTTLGMMSDLAKAHYVLGRSDEALLEFAEVIGLRQTRLGPDHPETLESLNELRYMLCATKSVPVTLKSERELRFILSSSKPIDYADAESACLEAVQLHPDNAGAQYGLGCVLAQQNRHLEAESAFREVVRLIPAFGAAHQDLAIALLKQAEATKKPAPWDEVATEFARAIELTEDTHATGSERKQVCRELVELGDELFARVVKLLPHETTLWIGRAHYHVLHHQWAKARADYAEVIHSRLVQDDAFEFAGVLLLLDDQQAYEQFCHDVTTRSGEPHDHLAGIIMARLCAIGPTTAVSPQQAVAWASHGAEIAQSAGFATHVLALAQYRSGQYDLAIHNLQKSNAGYSTRLLKAANWLLLSMIQSRLAHPEEARRCWETAQRMIARMRPSKSGDPAISMETDWIELNVLLPEAETLLSEQSTEGQQLISGNHLETHGSGLHLTTK